MLTIYSGPAFGNGKATVDNAEKYWKTVGCALFGKKNVFWYTLRDANPENEVKFAITNDLSTTPRYDLSCPSNVQLPSASSTPGSSSNSTSSGNSNNSTGSARPTSGAQTSGAAAPSGAGAGTPNCLRLWSSPGDRRRCWLVRLHCELDGHGSVRCLCVRCFRFVNVNNIA